MSVTSLIARLVERAGEPPKPRAVTVPDRDTDDELDYNEDSGYEDAEGQSFMIEYRDSRGNRSTRRITVWSINYKWAIPALYAKCHERNAMRSFRVDRIETIIDLDGEVHEDIPRTLSDIFDIDPDWTTIAALPKPSAPPRAPKPKPDVTPWNQLLNIARPHSWLICALSKADGQIDDAELDVAVKHAANLADTHAITITDSELDRYRTYLKRMCPTDKNVADGLARMAERDRPEIAAFLNTCKALILADGVVDPGEASLLGDIADYLMKAHGLSYPSAG